MGIVRLTREYEEWLGRQTALRQEELDRKHGGMDAGIFTFMRATYYWWASRFPKVCKKIAGAPQVTAIGDLHIENFGTWRDAEGRLAWGVNDFDEAWPLPYTNDLVRLATSAALAIRDARLSITSEMACESILAGYDDSLQRDGKSFVLGEEHAWIGNWSAMQTTPPEQFWRKMLQLPESTEPEASAVAALKTMLPNGATNVRFRHRVAGMGSLGKIRLVALGQVHGGLFAREAKALTTSACAWAEGQERPQVYIEALMTKAVRAPDPFLRVRDGWIVRRLAPDSRKIELGLLNRNKEHARLLRAMGAETANLHLGTKGARNTLLLDLKKRPPNWLIDAANAMVEEVEGAWRKWTDRNG